MRRGGHLYVLASQRNGTLYVGVTGDLMRRIAQHRGGQIPGFTTRYGIRRLVYAEWYPDIRNAIEREKRLKRWRRAWKIDLIESVNPSWRDLYPVLLDAGPGRLTDLIRLPPEPYVIPPLHHSSSRP